ncbi:WzyE family oligosaccharide polymerase [Shigella flexneri]
MSAALAPISSLHSLSSCLLAFIRGWISLWMLVAAGVLGIVGMSGWR